jgi:hypothetical protein
VSASSDAFERSIHRIHELIEQPGTEVTWDDRVPDPDNPSRQRQIDISIRRDGRLTLVECRLHQARQDVKWIEELVRRRASLNADGVIAVSESGFTEGAIKKARRFGIVLRDLRDLTSSEVSESGRSHVTLLYFYTYTDVELTLTFQSSGFVMEEANALAEAFRKSREAAAIFDTVADQADTRKLLYRQAFDLAEPFEYTLQTKDFLLAGRLVSTAKIAGRISLVEHEVDGLAVRAYGSPETDGMSRDVFVERFALGETGVVHDGGAVSFIVDVSSFEMPPLSQLRYVRLKGSVENDMASFEVVGIERFQVATGPFNLSLVLEGA